MTNPINDKMPVEAGKSAWSGRFSEPVSELVQRYTASVGFDQRLAEYDIQGSLAHAQMLSAKGIISSEDLDAITRGLDQVREKFIMAISSGGSNWKMCISI